MIILELITHSKKFSNKLLYYKNCMNKARQSKKIHNQMMKYDGKLYHESSHGLSCQFDLAGLFVTQERVFPLCSITGN